MDFESPRIVFYAVLIILFAMSFFGMRRDILGRKMKFLFTWVLIIGLLVAGFVYWDDVKNTSIYNALVPGTALTGDDRTLIFSRSADGHFYIDAEVNGEDITFLVDTGATDTTITRNDAEEMGIPTFKLQYDRYFETANGPTWGASITLHEVEIGDAYFSNVRASVTKGDLNKSLLGMSFLERLRSYEVKGDKLILYY